jgi:hypothetical protein
MGWPGGTVLAADNNPLGGSVPKRVFCVKEVPDGVLGRCLSFAPMESLSDARIVP